MGKKYRKSKKKEVDVVSTAVKLREADTEIIGKMDCYITKLRKQQQEVPDAAYREAKKALIRTGVATKQGNTKPKIVSWE